MATSTLEKNNEINQEKILELSPVIENAPEFIHKSIVFKFISSNNSYSCSPNPPNCYRTPSKNSPSNINRTCSLPEYVLGCGEVSCVGSPPGCAHPTCSGKKSPQPSYSLNKN